MNRRADPAAVADFREDLAVVEDVRRRLRAHLTAVRQRLERAMIAGEPWTAEEWSARMFGDPLRGAMARRLIWRLEHCGAELVLPGEVGLRNIQGERVRITSEDHITLWHPANDPAVQEAWRSRLAALGVEQPVEQTTRHVTLAEPCSWRLSFAAGERVHQTPFRGLLRCQGWDVPYMGRWFFLGEAAREVARHGATANLELDLDWASNDECPKVVVGDLRFRSALGTELDARALPPAIVSEAARDVLGAIARGGSQQQRASFGGPVDVIEAIAVDLDPPKGAA